MLTGKLNLVWLCSLLWKIQIFDLRFGWQKVQIHQIIIVKFNLDITDHDSNTATKVSKMLYCWSDLTDLIRDDTKTDVILPRSSNWMWYIYQLHILDQVLLGRIVSFHGWRRGMSFAYHRWDPDSMHSVACGRVVGVSGFHLHVWPQNANIRAFKNSSIDSAEVFFENK